MQQSFRWVWWQTWGLDFKISTALLKGLTVPSYVIKTCSSLSDEYDGKLGDWISRAFDSSRRQTWREDDHLPFTPQDHRGLLLNSSLLENDLKVRKCHAFLFLNVHEPKMDENLTISFKISAEVKISKYTFSSYFADEVYRLGKEYSMFFHSFIAWNEYALFFFWLSLARLMHLDHL